MRFWQDGHLKVSTKELVRDAMFISLISILLLVGCNPVTVTPEQTLTPTRTPYVEVTPSPSQTSQPTQTPPQVLPSPTELPRLVWLAPYMPEGIKSVIKLPDGYQLTDTSSEADVILEVGNQDVQSSILWVYALVAPFPTITDGVSLATLKSKWLGKPVETYLNTVLLMDQSTLEVFSTAWGLPASGVVQVLPAEELLSFSWSHQPSWAIIPFEALEPRWKVLAVDNQSPIRKDFDPIVYPLSISFVISGNVHLQAQDLSLPSTNRDASHFTTLAMTGVTALVRSTAFTMEHRGITYPASDIGSLLAGADITHISNEIPFSPDCPFPDPSTSSLVFCSSPSYIELLKAIGTDIVELTGDHFMDYGAQATIYTLDLYKDLGWKYFGGGENAEEARQPVLIENNGNRLAFMGCNVGCKEKTSIPCDATATESHPGAALCDFNWINSEIPELTEQGYQVVFTFQHQEYYTYTTEPALGYDFGQVAAAGAVIVSGSQAHQPHGFAFEGDSFIHYGLGNLFFDQYHFCADYACDNAFIDRHIFYAGRHISTELITIHFVDTARPRFMTPTERAHFLRLIFAASGW